MSDLRTAAQQALEAWNGDEIEWFKRGFTVMENLRAALAQQAEPRNQCGETCERAKLCATCARAMPQQAEPVAERAFLERILTAMEGVIDVADRKTDEFDALRSCVIDLTLMLHTAPPQRKPLPKHDQHCVDVPGYGLMAVRLVRAVERAHGIKE